MNIRVNYAYGVSAVRALSSLVNHIWEGNAKTVFLKNISNANLKNIAKIIQQNDQEYDSSYPYIAIQTIIVVEGKPNHPFTGCLQFKLVPEYEEVI